MTDSREQQSQCGKYSPLQYAFDDECPYCLELEKTDKYDPIWYDVSGEKVYQCQGCAEKQHERNNR